MPTSSEHAPAQATSLPADATPRPRNAEFPMYAAIVAQIQANDEAGLAQLYKLFSRGIRYYLYRQLGPQEIDDRLHTTFLIVVKAIRNGELREPERLMGFVRTVVRRQVGEYIEQAVTERKRVVHELRIGDALGDQIVDRTMNPEQEAMRNENVALMKRALARLTPRDRDILVRYYLLEQTEEQIRSEMTLTANQFRLYKSRAKIKFGEMGRRELAPATRSRTKIVCSYN